MTAIAITHPIHTDPSDAPVVTVDSQGVAASGVLSASSATLVGLYGQNRSASTRYIFLLDAASLPADGALPCAVPIPVSAGGTFSFEPAGGIYGAAGLVWASSSTNDTLTITGVADVWATANVVAG